MSVDASAYLVDWQKLLQLWQEVEPLDFWIEATEQEPEWIQLYAADDWQQSWKASSAASDTYEDIRDELEGKPQFDKFYKAFFSSSDSDWLQDLAGVKERWDELYEYFSITLSPETVKDYLELGLSLQLKHMEKPFEEKATKVPDWYMETFEEFEGYWNMWINLLREASKQGKGIVISIA